MAADIETLEQPAKKKRAGRGAGAGKGAGKGAGAGKRKMKAEGKAAPKAAAAEAPTLAEKRAQKRKRIAEANTVTFMMDTEVRKFISAQAKAAGMDIAPYMQKIVETHVLANAPADDKLAKRIAAKRAVLDHTVELARDMNDSGSFDEHFVLNVLKKAASDASFVSKYAAAVDADTADERALARAQAPINQQLGRLIKRAAGARGKRDANGKILRAQVQGEMISSYTLLEKA